MKKIVSPGRHFRVDHPKQVIGDGDVAFANGKSAFARGATYEDNPYRGDNNYLADQWGHGWVSAQVDSEAKTLRVARGRIPEETG